MRTCVICGRETYSPHARYCEQCRVAQNKKSHKKSNEKKKEKRQLNNSPSKPPANNIEKTMSEITRYNKKYGTRYNYGEYTALKRLGKV